MTASFLEGSSKLETEGMSSDVTSQGASVAVCLSLCPALGLSPSLPVSSLSSGSFVIFFLCPEFLSPTKTGQQEFPC